MDWTEKLEHKKKLRKMAYRMLWADFKNVVLGWKVILLALMLLGFLILPYVKEIDDFNIASMYYFVMWVITAICAFAETAFNYLPLSTKDIVYYLKIRTNHQEAWIVFFSCITAIIMDAAGVELFWERGVLSTIFLLTTVEGCFVVSMSGYCVPEKTTLKEAGVPLAKRVRQVIYIIYGIGLLFGSLIVSMFMKPEGNAKITVLVILCLYLILYIVRADVASWANFTECRQSPGRSMWAAPQQNQTEFRDMLNQ